MKSGDLIMALPEEKEQWIFGKFVRSDDSFAYIVPNGSQQQMMIPVDRIKSVTEGYGTQAVYP